MDRVHLGRRMTTTPASLRPGFWIDKVSVHEREKKQQKKRDNRTLIY